MNFSELLAIFQAHERTVQEALLAHGIARIDPDLERLGKLPAVLEDAYVLPDAQLCEAIRQHVAAKADLDATAPDHSTFTALKQCFSEGKLGAMRLLLTAGAATTWTADQKAIALGEVPVSPAIGNVDPFLFACRVGNLEAAMAYAPTSELARAKSPKAVTEAIKARATRVVAWLLGEGFDPNAVDDIGWGALERAVDNDDVATADVLLAGGAAPFGLPEKDYTSPVANAVSEGMRALFVGYNISPARFSFEVSPERTPLAFLPALPLTQENFDENSRARQGQANPERFLPTFWYEQMRTGRYSVPEGFVSDHSHPVWSFVRFGRSVTPLPDGRLVLIAGEHEDHYDSDFCIHADVTVLDGKGGVDHFIYPDHIFPPTDFHSATLVGDAIWLIASLGYRDRRQPGTTPVCRLDLTDFSIHPVKTTGDAPGWIHGHQAAIHRNGILVVGGTVEPGYRDNEDIFWLDFTSLAWRRVAHQVAAAGVNNP
jgi:hypothetical protein